MLRATLLLLTLAALSLPAERIFYLMGTYAVIDLPSEEDVYRAYRYMVALERKLSTYREDSEVSLVNRSAGREAVSVSEETAEVIGAALEIFRKTYGYFDITVGPEGRAGAPGALELGEGKLFLRKGDAAVDLGGIGKGYAVEKAYHHVSSEWGFIGLAGEMKVWGHRRVLGVKDPLSGGIFLLMVNRKDLCLSTSGNYYRRHIENRDTALVQVTVVYKDCTFADAYATALFSMERDLRRRFEEENPQVGILEIYSDGSFYLNDSFVEYFETLVLPGREKNPAFYERDHVNRY